jgi:hypothetical protein
MLMDVFQHIQAHLLSASSTYMSKVVCGASLVYQQQHQQACHKHRSEHL